MILILCPSCAMAVRTAGDDAEDLLGKESPYYPDKYPCPRCGAMAKLMDKHGGVMDVRDLQPAEAYAAFNGLGLPEERDCGEVAVKQLLSGARVVRVHTRYVHSGRCCLDRIEIEGGATVHLGSSSLGAVVYRISSPHSYVHAVERNT